MKTKLLCAPALGNSKIIAEKIGAGEKRTTPAKVVDSSEIEI